MLATLVVGIIFSRERGESGAETVVTLAVGCALMFAIPLICVECWHRIRFGAWLTLSKGGEGRIKDTKGTGG